MKNFKRFFLLLIVAIVATGTVNAKIVNFGIKAGMNVNKIHFNKSELMNDLINPGNSTGWEAGIMAEFNVPIIGLCFDASLMYSRMNNAWGDIIEDDGNGMPASTIDEGKVYGKNFLEIPINIKYKFLFPAVSNIVKPYIFTGPNFAFKLDKNVLENMKTRTCQVAWNVGVGVELVNRLQIGASYGFGINNIANFTSEFTDLIKANEIKANNNYWTITAAILF